MDITKRAAKALGLFVFPLAALTSQGAQASDELVADMPTPFGPVCVKQETTGGNWRHGFHLMRETVDHYFEVYPDELANYEATTLEKVKANPAFYLDRDIQFDVHYGKTGSFYRPFVSPFHEDGYVNFCVWPYGVDLWNKDIRADVSPLFYVDKKRDKLIQKLEHLPMYMPIHVWASVRSKSDGMPWVEVRGFEIIKEVSLSDSTLRHLEAGSSQLRQKRYDLAAQLLDQAIGEQLPVFAETRAFALLGRAEYEQRLFRGARNALVHSILRNPGVVANLVLLARADLRVDPEDGNFAEEAKLAAQKAIEIEPTNPEAHAELGLALAMLGDVRGGYQEIDYAQKFAPRGQLPEANRNRAMIAILEKNLELAKQELNQAVILRATDYTLHLELGDVHLAMGHLDDAKREFTQAKELAPNRAEPYYKTALVTKLQGDALDKDGKKDDATKAYTEALENVKGAITKDPHLTKAYGLEAEILRKLGKDDEAKKVLDQGAALNPNSPKWNDIYYDQAAASGDWDGMEKYVRAALNTHPDALHYARLGKILAMKPAPDVAGAVEALSKAVSLNNTLGDSFTLLGHIKLYAQNDASGAISALNEAVRLQPHNGDAWLDLAQANRAAGDASAAVAAADKASDVLKTNDAKLLAAQMRIERATGNDLAEALDFATGIESSTKVDAEKAKATFVRGQVLAKQNKLDEAQEAFTAAEPVLKDSSEFNLAQGRLLLAKGDLATAKDKLNSALEMARKESNVRVQTDAQKGLAEIDAAAAKGAPVVQNSNMKTTDGGEASNKKPMPPVIEEGNGSTEPVPAQVPGPR